MSQDDYLYAISPSGSGDRTDYKWMYDVGGGRSSPAIGSDGTIYVGGEDDYKLYAIQSSSSWTYASYQNSMKAYANSNWPKFGQNNFNTRRVMAFVPKSLPMDRIMKILEKNKDNE